MAKSLNRQIKRGHIQVETKTVITAWGLVYDPILGARWCTNIEKINVIIK